MSVKLNRPPKPEESQKNSNFNGKTKPYPRFEPGTSGLAVGSHNHCTIWVGCVPLSKPVFLDLLKIVFKSKNSLVKIRSKCSHKI
jgi:hypothetical protein